MKSYLFIDFYFWTFDSIIFLLVNIWHKFYNFIKITLNNEVFTVILVNAQLSFLLL